MVNMIKPQKSMIQMSIEDMLSKPGGTDRIQAPKIPIVSATVPRINANEPLANARHRKMTSRSMTPVHVAKEDTLDCKIPMHTMQSVNSGVHRLHGETGVDRA